VVPHMFLETGAPAPFISNLSALFTLPRGTLDQPLGLSKTPEVSIANNRVKNRNHRRAIYYKDFR
jgi:hypothetical protein